MSLTNYLISLARARTQQDRICVLRSVYRDRRFNPDQQAELRTLLDEACKAPDDRVRALRPILDPSVGCDLLSELKDGDEPVLSVPQKRAVEEWLAGWIGEAALAEHGVRPPGPLLLAGPTGCGKSMLASYLGSRLKTVRRGAVIDAHRVVSGTMGESGRKIAEAFRAVSANSGFVVIEEIDALAEARTEADGGGGASRENNRICITLMRLMDEAQCGIVATTNRAHTLDTALLRRFEYRLDFLSPDEDLRRQVLRGLLEGNPPSGLVALPLVSSVPLVSRMKRLQILRGLSMAEAAGEVMTAVPQISGGGRG